MAPYANFPDMPIGVRMALAALFGFGMACCLVGITERLVYAYRLLTNKDFRNAEYTKAGIPKSHEQ